MNTGIGVLKIKPGTTDVTLAIPLYDASDDLVASITITDLNIYYIRVETDNDVTISSVANLTALTALTDAHGDNKAYEIGQGYYRLDIPDAAFAVGADHGVIIITHDSSTSQPTTIHWQSISDAEKAIINKSTYTKSTGVQVIYNDDGTTTLLTQTMSDASGVETRTPS